MCAAVASVEDIFHEDADAHTPPPSPITVHESVIDSVSHSSAAALARTQFVEGIFIASCSRSVSALVYALRPFFAPSPVRRSHFFNIQLVFSKGDYNLFVCGVRVHTLGHPAEPFDDLWLILAQKRQTRKHESVLRFLFAPLTHRRSADRPCEERSGVKREKYIGFLLTSVFWCFASLLFVMKHEISA